MRRGLLLRKRNLDWHLAVDFDFENYCLTLMKVPILITFFRVHHSLTFLLPSKTQSLCYSLVYVRLLP